MNPNYRHEYVEPKHTSDKIKDAWDKTKEVGHQFADKTKETLTGEKPIERHEKKLKEKKIN
jgi:hypothetical protein